MPDDVKSGMTRLDVQRLDGIVENALSGLGIPGLDQAESTVLSLRPYTSAEARNQARYSWAAWQQIQQPAGDLIREGFDLEELPEGVDQSDVKAYLSKVGAQLMPEDRGALQALSRLYAVGNTLGGAAAVMIIDDGLPSWEPVDLERIQDLVSIEVLERDEITPHSRDGRGQAEFYVIGTSRTHVEPASIVHHTRVILSRGHRLMPTEEWRANGWGASVLESSHGPRMAMHAANSEMASLVLKTNQDVLYYADLEGMLCSEGTNTDGGRVSVEERTAQFARARSMHKVGILDGGKNPNSATSDPGRITDRLESTDRGVRGVADLGVEVRGQWAASIRQPPSIAFGLNLGGLNTGANAGDWQTWGGFIACEQETWLHPRLDRVLDVVFAAKLGPTGGRVPDGWKITFPPIWRPSKKEEAETAAIWATVDTSYHALEMVSSEELRIQRLEQGATGMLHLDPIPPPPEPGIEGDPGETELEPTEDEIAWSEAEPPADAATAAELVAGGELGDTSTRQIHSMARRSEITAYRGRSATKAPVYSLAEVKRAILIRNGHLEEEPVDETVRADAGLWRRLVNMVRRPR